MLTRKFAVFRSYFAFPIFLTPGARWMPADACEMAQIANETPGSAAPGRVPRMMIRVHLSSVVIIWEEGKLTDQR
jgi:hypothetical protein